MDKLNIDLKHTNYDIVFDTSFDFLVSYFKSGDKVMVVTDSNVDALYGNAITALLERAGANAYKHVFSAGEEQKHLDTIAGIYKSCADAALDRKSYILALGGGVCGDMAGFAAATYLRGIRFIQVPTTLLAQVDSSVGGKVGVDFEGGKNLIGAFYQPSLVLVNINTLKTLPDRDFKSGFAEVIKYGIIHDSAFFDYLDKNLDRIFALDPDTLSYVIKTCCDIKGQVVSFDERETGLRAILNYGHTIGHAIESSLGFSLYHGECVALGMAAAAYLSFLEGVCDLAVYTKTVDLLNRSHLPAATHLSDPGRVMEFMQKDKKKEAGVLTFVLAEEIGKVRLSKVKSQTNIKTAVEKVTVH